jgi:hypothetical protein
VPLTAGSWAGGIRDARPRYSSLTTLAWWARSVRACLAGGLDGDSDELSARAGLDERETEVDGYNVA